MKQSVILCSEGLIRTLGNPIVCHPAALALERAVFDVRAGEFAGGVPRRAVGRDAGHRLGQPDPARGQGIEARRAVAVRI